MTPPPDFFSSLLSLTSALASSNYTFYSPTPETHAKVFSRLAAESKRKDAIDRVKARSVSRSRERSVGRGGATERGASRGLRPPPAASSGYSGERGRQLDTAPERSILSSRSISRGRPSNVIPEAQTEGETVGGEVPADEAAAKALGNKLALRASNARDVFGWSMPIEVSAADIDDVGAEFVHTESPLFSRQPGGLLVPLVRVSNLYPFTTIPPHPHLNLSTSQRESLSALEEKQKCILYAHSAFPTTSQNSVFFGPDTYRFLCFLVRSLGVLPPPCEDGTWKLGVDVGTGAGAGALCLAGLRKIQGARGADDADVDADGLLVNKVLGTDINPLALCYAQVNAQSYHSVLPLSPIAAAGPTKEVDSGDWKHRLTFREASLLDGLTPSEEAQVDLIVSNPPYIAFGPAGGQNQGHGQGQGQGQGQSNSISTDSGYTTAGGATYADGGHLGIALPLHILHSSLARLRPGGVVLLYTGVPVSLDGTNPLWEACQAYHRSHASPPPDDDDQQQQRVKAKMEYWDTMDVDVFGDELEDQFGPYGRTGVGRIEVVGVAMRRL